MLKIKMPAGIINIEEPKREAIVIEKQGVKKPIKSSHRHKVKDNVKIVLEKKPHTTANDLMLCIEYWDLTEQAEVKKTRKKIKIEFDREKILKATLPETISRARRELHQDQEISYSEEVEQRRQISRKETQGYYSKSGEDAPISEVF